MMHQGLALRSLLKLDMLIFLFLWLWIGNGKWHVLHVDHVYLDICKQHDLVFHNTNEDCLYVDIVFPVPWKA